MSCKVPLLSRRFEIKFFVDKDINMLDIVFLVVKKLNSKFPQRVLGLYITGSTARKEAEEYSDLDVVAIVDGDLDPREISKIFDGDVQVNVFKRGELRREVKEDPTIALMIKEGIPIKPLSNIDEDLSFTREDILKA
ncbi:MAG: nucleotidyltransferase domain-containing protein, partial [Archaeoglobaceae archaeon]